MTNKLFCKSSPDANKKKVSGEKIIDKVDYFHSEQTKKQHTFEGELSEVARLFMNRNITDGILPERLKEWKELYLLQGMIEHLKKASSGNQSYPPEYEAIQIWAHPYSSGILEIRGTQEQKEVLQSMYYRSL